MSDSQEVQQLHSDESTVRSPSGQYPGSFGSWCFGDYGLLAHGGVKDSNLVDCHSNERDEHVLR